MPFLTRMLDPSDFGVITVFESIYGVMTIIFSLGVADSITRYYYEEKNDFKTAAGTMYVGAFVLSIIFLLIVLFFRESLADQFSIPVIVIFYAGILSFSDIPKTIFLQLLNAREKSKIYSIYATIASFLSLSFTLLFVYLLSENKYEGRFLGQLIPATLFFVIAQVYIFKHFDFKFKIDTNYLKYFFNYSLPLIPYRLSGILLTYVDSVIIAKIVGLTETGLYSIAYRVGMGILILHVSISQALEPKIMLLMNNYDDNIKIINGHIDQAAKYLFYFGFLISVFAKYILIVLVPESYYGALDLVPIIILSYCLLFIFEQFTRINRYFKKTNVNAIAMLISVGVNIVLNLFLIPKFGYKIAAVTTLISFIVMLSVLWYNSRFQLKIKAIVDLDRIILKTLLPISLIFCFTVYISVEIMFVDILIKSFISLILLYFLFQKEIRNYLIKTQ